MTLSVIFYPYHFVRAILSIPFCPMPFCPYTILSIPFCPYHFVRYHFVLELRTLAKGLRQNLDADTASSVQLNTTVCFVSQLNYSLPVVITLWLNVYP